MAQGLESSRFSRELVNLFAGMCFGSPELPRVLFEGGYSCHSIEQLFPLDAVRSCNPEMILVSERDGHTLILEWKSGANLNREQLERYVRINSVSLPQAAQIPSAAAESYSLLLIGKEENAARLAIGLAQVADSNRIFALRTSAGIEKSEGSFFAPRLEEAFRNCLVVDWDLVPNRFLPVDAESQDWEFAEYLLPEVIAKALAGVESVNVDVLAKAVILHWDLIDRPYKNKLRTRILEVLRRAAGRRFRAVFSVSLHRKANATVNYLRSEAQSASRYQTKLSAAYRNFMNDLNSPQMELPYSGPTIDIASRPTEAGLPSSDRA